jgi:pilus assembly protein FimV
MMRKKLPADRAMGAQKSMEKPQWRATALAIATAVLLGVSALDANALGLGRVTVQSALGEPLRAQIEVPEINAEELASLRTGVASPEAFRAAGLEYNQAITGIRITLERRPDGRHFLQLSSDRAVSEPFLDLILETQWASGRIMRDYTLLFDPPSLRQGAPLQAQVSPPAPSRASPSAPAPSAKVPAARPAAAAPATAAARQPAAPRAPSGEGKQVTVQSGDNASKIVAAHKPASVSLDQMLVALLNANPEAFIGGNVNRLKAGAVLDVPTAEQAGMVPSGEASQTVIAQSRDFNEFRRRLAEGLPTTRIAPSDRQASGKVQAQVEDKKPGAATPDKLTLSKGAVQGKAVEDKIARDRAAQDATTRVAELNKNISDLNKLGTATAPAAAVSASAAKTGVAVPVGSASASRSAAATAPVAAVTAPASAAKPAVPLPATSIAPAAASTASAPIASTSTMVAPAATTASAAAPASPAVASASAAASPASAASPVPATDTDTAATTDTATATATAAITPASAPIAAAPPRPAAPVPVAETTLVDDLLENPIVPATLGGVLALLLGFGFYRAQQRKKSTQVDSSFLESRLQPDSFFGASGGQRIDTNEGGATGSSMVYSPSQLDAAGDVDPVAEADVYLAYGRDLQAEEILKEAIRTTPQRVAIHSKLLEIYSKRRDGKAFELVATEAYGLTRGEGPEWEHICELGKELDPSSLLYRPGGQPTGAAPAAPAAAAAVGFAATTPVMPAAAAPAPSDLDLDLDFSLGDDGPGAASAPQPTLVLHASPVPQPMPSLDMDFGTATVAMEAPGTAPMMLDLPVSRPEPARLDAPDLTLNKNSLSFSLEPAKARAPAAAAPAQAPVADAGMIEFDLGALSLDLGGPATATAAVAMATATEPDTADAALSTAGSPLVAAGYEDTGSDPLATKLALAEEFNAIGDPDGARSLAQEVLAEASGDLKNRAQRFLAEIS